MKFDKLGWIVAAAMAGGFLGMGFQPTVQKFATVDMAKVFDDADLTKVSGDKLQVAQATRQNIIRFIQENQVMAPTDAPKYAELSIKSPMTDVDKAEIARITNDALAASNKQRDLATKQSPTAEDMKSLQDFSSRAQANAAYSRKLGDQYTVELRTLTGQLHDQSMDKVRESIKKIAEKQAYTIVFSEEAAPYAGNDITKQALDEMNKK